MHVNETLLQPFGFSEENMHNVYDDDTDIFMCVYIYDWCTIEKSCV